MKNIFAISIPAEATQDTKKKSVTNYQDLAETIDELFPQLTRQDKSYIAYFYQGKKIINVNRTKSGYRTYFFYPGSQEVSSYLQYEGLRSIEREEALNNGWGKALALFEGTCATPVLEMLLAWQIHVAKI